MITIVVPTYKEAKNIPVLTKELHRALDSARMTYSIVVVDDNSNDGTVEAVSSLKSEYPIQLLVRKNEKGLSSAVVAGIRLAQGDIIVVMDADLSHPPVRVPELVRQISENHAEFAIGSRFVPGGSAPHFNWFRKLNALVSKIMAFPFVRVKDPMAGFFAFPRSIMTDIDKLNPLGFKIGLEIMVKCAPKKIIEIPIEFQDRLYGESKLSIKEQVNYLLHLWRLFNYKYHIIAEMFRFGIVGLLGMVIDLSCVRIAFGSFDIPFRYSRIIGFVIALTFNFFLNKKFNFKKAKQRNTYLQYGEFLAVCLAGFSVNWLISVGLFERFAFFNTHYLVASFFGVLGGFVVNFCGSKFLVFRK